MEMDYVTIKNKTEYLLSELLRQKTYLFAYNIYINQVIPLLNTAEDKEEILYNLNNYLSFIFNETSNEYEILFNINNYLNNTDPLEFLFSDEYEFFIGCLKLINNSKVKREVEYLNVTEKYLVLANTNGFKKGNHSIYFNTNRPVTNDQYHKILELIPQKKP